MKVKHNYLLTGDKKDYSKGLEVLKSALSSVPMESMGYSTLSKLKTGVESSGTTYPYNLPPKVGLLVLYLFLAGTLLLT